MFGRRMLIVIVAVALGAVPGVAMANLSVQLSVTVPKHVTTHTPIPISGTISGEQGAELVAAFFSKDRCVRTYASAYRLSEHVSKSGVGYLTAQDEQYIFSLDVTLGNAGKHARWLCVYAYHAGSKADTTVTDKLIASKV
jgi:hypothetical protein